MADVLIPVQYLVENGHLCDVPKSYIIPEEDRPSCVSIAPGSSTRASAQIPVIDLQGSEGEGRWRILEEIRKAGEEWGFFQVVNHGIPSSLMKSQLQVTAEFFQLPHDEKMLYATDEMPRLGAQGYGSKIAYFEGLASDWGDQIRHAALPVSSRRYELWPTNPPAYSYWANHTHQIDACVKGFLEDIWKSQINCLFQGKTQEEFIVEVDLLVQKLLGLLSESLGLRPSSLEDSFGDYLQNLVVNYYPECPQPDLVMGLQKHSDFGGLTLLLQDGTPGLQVHKAGEWITIEPIEDAFVVNLGDQIEILTNGRYPSVEHRAYVNSSKPRISIVAFSSPALDAITAPITELIDEAHPALYKACTFAEYRRFFFARGCDGKAQLQSLKIST